MKSGRNRQRKFTQQQNPGNVFEDENSRKGMAKKKKRRRHSHKKKKNTVFIDQTTLMQGYGMTKYLINKYLPEPELRENPRKPSGPPLRVWTVGQISEALNNPDLQRALLQKREKAERRKALQKAEREKMVSYLQLFDIEQYRERAASMDRRFILHVGPTNSGKTYNAIQALKEGYRGAYLGPLRLLALEMFDTLNEDGYPCELLTGEEYVETEGAFITASTIELCDYYEEYDVAVIDEAQMISDSQRGDKWTKAIYLIKAKEVHICLAPQAEKLICNILDGFGARYEIEYHDRLAPLEFHGTIESVKDAQPGDALIVFSRRAVLATAAELQDTGLHASVIYGALPPVSRREEVRKFASGENTVVVATDAIGMGISLPIKRVLFMETSKYDGEQTRLLNSSEIKQIAGRAGRFGIYDKGEVLTMYNPDLVEWAISSGEEQLECITLPFPEEALGTEYPLMKLLTEWQELPEIPGFRRTDMEEAIYLLKALGNEEKRFDKDMLYRMITCPVDIKDDRLVQYWKQCCQAIVSGRIPEIPDFPDDTLEECEFQYKALDIRHQLLRQIDIEEDCMEEKTALCEKINRLLLENKHEYLKRCRVCNRVLPATYPFGICDRCFRNYRSSGRHWM